MRGNPGKHAINHAEPQPEPLLELPPPQELDDDGRECWNDITSELKDLGMLASVDSKWLTLTCQTYSKLKKYNAKIAQFGEIVKAPSGYPIISPYVSMAHKAQTQLMRLLDGLGMNPSARTGVKAVSGRKSKLDRFLEKTKKRA